MRFSQFLFASGLGWANASIRTELTPETKILPDMYCAARIVQTGQTPQGLATSCDSSGTCHPTGDREICCKETTLSSVAQFYPKMQAVIKEALVQRLIPYLEAVTSAEKRDKLSEKLKLDNPDRQRTYSAVLTSPCTRFLAAFLLPVDQFVQGVDELIDVAGASPKVCELRVLLEVFNQKDSRKALAAILDILLQVPSRRVPEIGDQYDSKGNNKLSRFVYEFIQSIELTPLQSILKRVHYARGTDCHKLVEMDLWSSGVAHAAKMHQCVENGARMEYGHPDYTRKAMVRMIEILAKSKTFQNSFRHTGKDTLLPILMYYVVLASQNRVPPPADSLACSSPELKSLFGFIHGQ